MDGAGAVVKSYDYDEFGVTTSTGDTFFNEVTFTGSALDASGLLYMNARYYNPSTARFLSQDSYTGSAFDPWTQHLYAYCNNNPVNMVDPTGHAPVGPMRKNMVCINDGGSGLSSYELMERSVTPEPQPQYITNQHDESIADLPFGWSGNVAGNGCGMVALYNVLVAAGNNLETFEEFNASFNMDLLNLHWTHLLGGAWGMNPIAVRDILYDEFGRSNVGSNIFYTGTNYDAIIVVYLRRDKNGLGGHYFAAIAHTPGNYTLYNIDRNDSVGPYDMENLRTYALGKGFVIGSWGITFERNNLGKKGVPSWKNGREDAWSLW